MSMSADQENFEELRRLLALKRHEQPPPGYFNDFSRQVIARIKAGESAASDSFLFRVTAGMPWLQALWNGFEAKPIVAGAFGIGVCSLLVVGLVSSERMDPNSAMLSPSVAPSQAVLAVPVQNAGLFERAFVDRSATGSVFTAQSRSSIFDEIRNPRVESVNFTMPATSN